jgi:hypothetical protein
MLYYERNDHTCGVVSTSSEEFFLLLFVFDRFPVIGYVERITSIGK